MKKLIGVMVMLMVFSFGLSAFADDSILLTVGMPNSPWYTPYNSYKSGVITEIVPVNDKICKVVFGNITEYLRIGDFLYTDRLSSYGYKIESFDYNVVKLVRTQKPQ